MEGRNKGMKKAFIILGNGFTIDLLQHLKKINIEILEKIDVSNLFKFGDKIHSPWDNRPGFLSYKSCPSLWLLGARPSNTVDECTALIEEIITCANMFFDFVNEPDQKQKRVELMSSDKERIYLRAYSELIVYLRQLFSFYNDLISDNMLENFILQDSNWGWKEFFSKLSDSKYERITIVTYNYDVWLERILKILNVPYSVKGFIDKAESRIEIIKPHGSISFVPKDEKNMRYAINYSLDFDGVTLDKLRVEYDELSYYEKGAIIPPAGDSLRLGTTNLWANELREEAKTAAKDIKENDEIILCGISYWHVDRREIDELLINLNQNANLTFINPKPPRDLNAVLSSIFEKYVQQSSSKEIGVILNG